VEVRGSYILVLWWDVVYGGAKKFKNQWRSNSMPKKSKRITSEGSGVSEIDAMPGIRVEGKTLYWGPFPVGVIASTRGSVIKVLYMCPICGAVYSHARHWRYHLRSKHPEEYREMVEAGRAAIRGYRARLEAQLRGVSSVTSTSSVSSLPATSSVPRSLVEETLRKQLETSALRVSLPSLNLPMLNPPKWKWPGEESK